MSGGTSLLDLPRVPALPTPFLEIPGGMLESPPLPTPFLEMPGGGRLEVLALPTPFFEMPGGIS